jgi:N-acetyl-anhydromuramyl-L-alanine amidase AmpD
MEVISRLPRRVALLALVIAVAGAGAVVAARVLIGHWVGPPAPGNVRQSEFSAAAKEFGVPEELLLAVAYNRTWWEDHHGQPSTDGGYGPMGLTTVEPAAKPNGEDAKGAEQSASTTTAVSVADTDPALHTLDLAAALLGLPEEKLRTNSQENIRGGAAVLADAARKRLGGRLPSELGHWYGAVAVLSGTSRPRGAVAFADDVYDTLRSGAARSTLDGQAIWLPATAVTPSREQLDPGAASSDTECPPELDCRFVPAAYGSSDGLRNSLDLDDHVDPANGYGNFDHADRPADGQRIQYIVIHDTEGVGSDSPYDSVIASFENLASGASAHYVIRSSDGQVTQMVRTRDVAWHAGNWTFNEHSIGIEHEAFATQGGTWYTEQMYRASARLVRYLAARYDIPLDRQHILGHEDIPREIEKSGYQYFGDAHWDPGPHWDWEHYMDLLGAPISAQAGPNSQIVTLRPQYATNQPQLQGCDDLGQGCQDLPTHGANFVYLRTSPSEDAPLRGDGVLQGGGSVGTILAHDWADKAVAGRCYAVAERRGEWTAIWYGGDKTWFHNPGGRLTVPAGGRLVRAKAGRDAVPLYGRAFPDEVAYPPTIAVSVTDHVQPIPWTLPAGQLYPVLDEFTGEKYYARYDPTNVPGNHTLVHDNTRYLLISFNHRVIFVKAEDVDLV